MRHRSPYKTTQNNKLFSTLASKTSYNILLTLYDSTKPLRYTDLCRIITGHTKDPVFAHHLRRLKQQGLVTARKMHNEREIWYVMSSRGTDILEKIKKAILTYDNFENKQQLEMFN